MSERSLVVHQGSLSDIDDTWLNNKVRVTGKVGTKAAPSGAYAFRIAGVVLSEPDRVSVSLSLGPRVFLSPEGLARNFYEAMAMAEHFGFRPGRRPQDVWRI